MQFRGNLRFLLWAVPYPDRDREKINDEFREKREGYSKRIQTAKFNYEQNFKLDSRSRKQTNQIT